MDRPRITPSRTRCWTSRAVLALGVLALSVTPVVSVGAWLVMSDPAVAADVAAEGDLWPIVRAIAETIGDAVRDLLAMF
ncbi:MAG: hypothetical protein JNL48_03260 [Acidobacteria bacterium]|nr:hypothetical protein [Acidobacteriota bacterium]